MAESSSVVEYTEAVAAAIEAVFDDRVAGVWLLGSNAYGGANESSDIDIQAAVRDAAQSEVTELAGQIAHPYLPCPAVGLEFVLYDAEELVEPSVPLRWLLNLNGGPARDAKVSLDPRSEPWHWFVLDLAIGRHTAITIHGQDLADVVGPIDKRTQVEAIAESQRWHLAHDRDGANRIANAARGLRFLRTGVWGSKPDGITWARTQGLAGSGILEQLASALVDDGEPA